MFLLFKNNKDRQININDEIIILHQNKEYIIPNGWQKFMPDIKDFNEIKLKQYNINIDLNNKKLLFIRSYAYGDLLILSSLVNFIKKKYPSAIIDFAITNNHHDLIKLIDCIDTAVSLPIKKEDYDKYDYHFSVAGLIENNNIDKNIYDEYYEHLGCDSSKIDDINKKPYPIKNNNKTSEYIGLHLFARAKNRSYPISLIDILVNNLNQMFNKKIIIFSDFRQYNNYRYTINPHITTWCYENIMETKKYLENCQFVISVDSFITHFAQALNIPTIALYGAYSSKSRVKYYTNIKIIDTTPNCRCRDHSDKCPKQYNTNIPPCLNIDPLFIINTINNNNIINLNPEVKVSNTISFINDSAVKLC